MATIVTKNSSTASAVPTTSDLVQGELAVNVTDKRIFTENASTQIVELGTNPSTVTTTTATVSGTLTANGTFASSNAVVTGGSVNSTPIGATTPSTVRGSTVTATTGFVGGLTGDVVGNVTGNVTGNITGVVTGNVTGNVTGDVTGNITASSGTSTFTNVTINGGLDMNAGTSATITNLASPTNTNDAATKGYVDTADATKLNLSGGTMSGAIAMGAAKITGLADPTAAQDAATKIYVDNSVQGLDAKASCRAGTTANITLSGAQTIDGVSVVAGDRVLVKDQTSAAENGIYVAAASGWARSADANTWDELVNAYSFVEDGTANANNGFVASIVAGGTLGSTAVTWVQFSGAGQVTAGAGMTKSGNTLDVGTAAASRIVVNADNIDLATSGVTAATYRSVTTDAYGRITGGTNPTTVSGYGLTDVYTKTEINTSLATKLNLTGGTMSGAIAMGTNKITGAGDPTAAQDVATKAYTDSILGSATSAATSAAAAATSASNASTSASGAATSATNAGNSATAAASSAAAAATTYDNFDDRYLGDKSSDPTVDNDGNALLTGALYFNTTSDAMKVYTGSAWAAVAPTATSVTLSQVTDFPTQSGQLGKYLTTDGTTPSWVEAEAGGNSLSFVASGAISAGQTVALQSDGTVTAIASEAFTETSGSPVTFQASAIAYTSTVFDEVNGKIVIFYRDTANSGYGTAVVGTVSGTSISFGTPVVFVSSAPLAIKATYLSGAGKIGIAYYVGSSIKTIIGTVSGTSISFGTQSDTGATSASVFACAYHASTSSFIVSFRNPSLSNYGQAKAAVVSGTSFSSWGSAISFNSANTQQISMIYDPFRDVSVVCYKDAGGTSSLEVVLFTLTSGNPTYISKSFNWNLNLTACGLTAGMAIDSRDNKIIVMGDSYNEIKVTRFQVNADQYNITIDQATGLATGQYSYYDLSCVYDSNSEKAVLVYSDLSNPRPMKLIVATFPVGTANPSLGSVYSIDTVGATDPSAAFDSSQNKVVVVYEDQTNVNGKTTVFQNASTSSNYLDFVGLSSESISDTASGTINLYGSINEAQTGLTVASNYYVQFDGTIDTTESSVKIGKALTSTKLLVSGV